MRKSTGYLRVILGASLLAATLTFVGCAETGPAETGGMTPGAMEQPAATQAEAATTAATAANPAATDELQNSDCQKCHDAQPAEINADGGKHKTAVTCMDCHIEHLPLGQQTIPQCSMCHEGEGHFQLNNCLGCHRNPHTPLRVTVDDTPEVMKGCLTCHSDKGEEFAKYPSKHAEKNCTFCHPRQHKVIKKCLSCHEPHIDSMVFEDCLRCHRPHSPLEITYAEDTPSKLCGACHTDIFDMLTKNSSKHHDLTCAYCHKNRHPTVPVCKDCHEAPHSPNLLNSFPDCLKCHNNPHNLLI